MKTDYREFTLTEVQNLVEDCVKRIGWHILAGGSADDRYIKDLMKMVEDIQESLEGIS